MSMLSKGWVGTQYQNILIVFLTEQHFGFLQVGLKGNQKLSLLFVFLVLCLHKNTHSLMYNVLNLQLKFLLIITLCMHLRSCLAVRGQLFVESESLFRFHVSYSQASGWFSTSIPLQGCQVYRYTLLLCQALLHDFQESNLGSSGLFKSTFSCSAC